MPSGFQLHICIRSLICLKPDVCHQWKDDNCKDLKSYKELFHEMQMSKAVRLLERSSRIGAVKSAEAGFLETGISNKCAG